MDATVTIDKAGRIIIPKKVRDELRLEPGDSLTLESRGEQVILRPLDSNVSLQKERGIWTFRGKEPLSLEEANQIVRATREPRGGRSRD
jgi:AbrB family looped-hinge helix DNA binding protein